MTDPQMELNELVVEALKQHSTTTEKLLDTMVAMATKIDRLEQRIFELECQMQLTGGEKK